MASTQPKEEIPKDPANDDSREEEKNDDDYPEEKSVVKPKGQRAKRPREYQPGDRVSTSIKEGQWFREKVFIVERYREDLGYWQYQLADELTGRLAENGKWFGEGDLSAA